MTTTVSVPTQTSPLVPIAAATIAATFTLTALGTIASPGAADEHGWQELLIVGGIGTAATVLVFWLVSRRRGADHAGATALVLAAVGLLSVVAFWLGITPALGAGGVVLGLAARRSGRQPGAGTAAVAVGALALVGYAVIYVGDFVSRL